MLYAFICLLLVFYFWKSSKTNPDLPSGPWGFPILGHLPLLGLTPFKKLLEWKKIYGNIFFIRFGSFPTIVLNDADVIREAFCLPAFSGRPRIDAITEGTEGKGIGWSEGLANTEQRQFLFKALKSFNDEQEGVIKEEISNLLNYLQENSKRKEPILVNKLFTTFILNSMWNFMMGEKFHKDDEEVHRIISLIQKTGEIDSILEQLSFFMPWIGKLMGRHASGHDARVKLLKDSRDYVKMKIDPCKLTWVKDQPRQLTDAYLDRVTDTQDLSSSFHEKNDFQPFFTMDMFGASVATTVSSLEWLIFHLATHLDIQNKLQKEIERVVGNSRLPSLSDRSKMPYTEATISELLRYSSIFPMGIFHRTVTDVQFHGYKIPRNTMVISNLYAVHHDPTTWGDPQNFRPDRFIGFDGMCMKSKQVMAFSVGRRGCPGEAKAKDELFLYTTSLCQTFDMRFSSPVPNVKPTLGMTLAPTEFHVHFTERVHNL